MPTEARWNHLQDNAKQPTIGKLIDDAMVAIERNNPKLKGVLPKDFARPSLDKQRLGEVIDLIGTIAPGDAAIRSNLDGFGVMVSNNRDLTQSRRGAKSQ